MRVLHTYVSVSLDDRDGDGAVMVGLYDVFLFRNSFCRLLRSSVLLSSLLTQLLKFTEKS